MREDCLTKLLVSSLSWIVKEEEPADKVNNAGEGGKTTGGLECVGLSVLPESAPIMRGSGGRAFRTGPSAHAGKPTAGGKREEREGDCAKIAHLRSHPPANVGLQIVRWWPRRA